MIPNRASDAGPDSRYKTHDCAHCGECHSVTMRCQGAAPDICCERLCTDCAEDAARCDNCNLPACPDHLAIHPDNPDVKWCDTCRADRDDDCRCVRVGDIEDASDCATHGGRYAK